MLQPHRKIRLLPDSAISPSGHATVKISATAIPIDTSAKPMKCDQTGHMLFCDLGYERGTERETGRNSDQTRARSVHRSRNRTPWLSVAEEIGGGDENGVNEFTGSEKQVAQIVQ
jgi:hypothetical protein